MGHFGPGTLTRPHAREREREREPFWLKCCTFCLEGLFALGGGLTWTVTPGEPSRLHLRCLRPIAVATLLQWPSPCLRDPIHTRGGEVRDIFFPVRDLKTHDRNDLQCRLHGIIGKANVPPERVRSRCRQSGGTPATQSPTPRREPPAAEGGTPDSRRGGCKPETSTTTCRPLAEMTAFETRKGLVLLYEPEPLDERIGKEVQEDAEGRLKDTETRGTHSRTRVRAHKAYQRRHQECNEEGRRADQLVRIIDKYLPKQAEETRIYVGRFPNHVRKLLYKARRIRNKMRKRRGGEEAESNTTVNLEETSTT